MPGNARSGSGGLVVIAILAVAVLLFLSAGLGTNDLVGGDEGYYGIMALNIIESPRYIVDPSLTPLGPPGDKPFLYPLYLAAAMRAGGAGEVPIRWATLLSGVLSAVFIYLVASILVGKKTGVFAAALYLFSPYLAHTGRTVSAEPLLVMISLAGAWLMLKGARSGSARVSLLSGILFGLAFLVKLWLAVIPMLAVAAGIFMSGEDQRVKVPGTGRGVRLLAFMATGFLAAASAQIIMCLLFSPGNLRHWLYIYAGFSMADRLSGEGFAAYWKMPWHFYPVLAGRISGLFVALVPLGMIYIARVRKAAAATWTLSLWILVMAPLAAAAVKSGGYIQPIMPAIFIAGGAGLSSLWRHVRSPLFSRASLAAAAFAAILISILTQVSFAGGRFLNVSSPSAVLVQSGWTAAILLSAGSSIMARKATRLLLYLMAAGVVIGGISRGLGVIGSRDHITGYRSIAERLDRALGDIDPEQPCFMAPEWPAMSFYTFRTGIYWRSPYGEADPAYVLSTLENEMPFFYVVGTGGIDLYGGLPSPSVREAIERRGHILETGMPDLQSGPTVYVNEALWRRITATDPGSGSL